MKPIVHAVKHYVQFPITQITTATAESIILAQAVESTVANSASEVEEGALVKAVYIELWLENQGNLGESIVTVCKDTKNGGGPTFSNMAALFTYINKKNIFFTHQGLTSNDGVSQPTNVLRGWIKIPKGKQRMGLGDTIVLNISNTSSNSLNRCGFATYKEYS